MAGDFVEVHVKYSLDECIDRDMKGHYRKALSDEAKNSTGVCDLYEEPENLEVPVDTESETLGESAEKILGKLKEINCAQIAWDSR